MALPHRRLVGYQHCRSFGVVSRRTTFFEFHKRLFITTASESNAIVVAFYCAIDWSWCVLFSWVEDRALSVLLEVRGPLRSFAAFKKLYTTLLYPLSVYLLDSSHFIILSSNFVVCLVGGGSKSHS